MATWIQEEAPSNYGKKAKKDLQKHRAKYYCAASELFHVTGERGMPQSPMRMAMAHKHTIKSESSGDVGKEGLQDGCNFNPISMK